MTPLVIAISSLLHENSASASADRSPPVGSTLGVDESNVLLHNRLRKNSWEKSNQRFLPEIIFKRVYFKDIQGSTKSGWGHSIYLQIPLPSQSLIYQLLKDRSFLEGCIQDDINIDEMLNTLLSEGEIMLSEGSSLCTDRRNLLIYKDKGFTAEEIEKIADGIDRVLGSFQKLPSHLSSAHESKVTIPKSLESMEQSVTNSGGTIVKSGDGQQRRLDQLRGLGVTVYEDYLSQNPLTWNYLAGYVDIKQEIQDTLVNALAHPEIYDAIAKQTRQEYEEDACRPRAILFEGPPGTGKTLTARIIASQVEKPLVLISGTMHL